MNVECVIDFALSLMAVGSSGVLLWMALGGKGSHA
jgi:hypothetical protein